MAASLAAGEVRMTLYEHVEELIALLEESELAAPELRPEFDAVIRSQIAGTKEKVDRINGVLSELENVAMHATEEIERLQKRKASALRHADRLKQYVLDVMAGAGLKKVEGLTSGFTMRCNAPGIDVFDLEAVPADFIRVVETRSADKKAIKEAMARGADVPGVRLVQTLSLIRR